MQVCAVSVSLHRRIRRRNAEPAGTDQILPIQTEVRKPIQSFDSHITTMLSISWLTTASPLVPGVIWFTQGGSFEEKGRRSGVAPLGQDQRESLLCAVGPFSAASVLIGRCLKLCVLLRMCLLFQGFVSLLEKIASLALNLEAGIFVFAMMLKATNGENRSVVLFLFEEARWDRGGIPFLQGAREEFAVTPLLELLQMLPANLVIHERCVSFLPSHLLSDLLRNLPLCLSLVCCCSVDSCLACCRKLRIPLPLHDRVYLLQYLLPVYFGFAIGYDVYISIRDLVQMGNLDLHKGLHVGGPFTTLNNATQGSGLLTATNDTALEPANFTDFVTGDVVV